MRLVSRAHLDFKTGSIAALPLDELVGHTAGLLALTGSGRALLGRLLGAGQGAGRDPPARAGWPSCSTAGSISSCSATARTTSGASRSR
jgi:hypothetical protein